MKELTVCHEQIIDNETTTKQYTVKEFVAQVEHIE
jgi:hypothetical protein